MLSNKKDSSYNAWNGTYEMSSLDKFVQAERRLTEKKLALEDMKNEYELIELQTFNTYKSNIQYWQLSTRDFINKSKDWLNMLTKGVDKDGNKLDKRKKYEEKDIFNYYIGYIKELLGIDSMENIRLLNYNFGEGNIIEFDYLGRPWALEIPFIDGVKLRSFQDYGNSVFKLKLRVKTSEHCWKQIGNTYEEDELKDIMANGINEYCDITNE